MKRTGKIGFEGFTLLEMMVGLVIFMIGVLGLAGMIILQSKSTRTARGLDDASTLVQSKIEDMANVNYSDLGNDSALPSTNGLTNAAILTDGPLNRLGQTIGTGTGPYGYYRHIVVCSSTTSNVAPAATPAYCSGAASSARPSELSCSPLSPALTAREKMIRVLAAWTDRTGQCHFKAASSLAFQ